MHAPKTLVLALAALAALAAGTGSAALADTKAGDDRRGDAKCDGSPCPDLKSAIAGHGIFDETELFYIVTQHNAVERGRLPRIAINTRGSGSSRPEFYVEKRSSGPGVFKAKTGRKVGAAVWTNPGTSAATWTFLPSAIGSPPRYGWRVEIAGSGGGRIDAAPDHGYLVHRLR